MEDKNYLRTYEAEKNTAEALLDKFEKLLLGMNTKDYAFKSKEEKEKLVKGILQVADYRIKEGIIKPTSELGKILSKIKKLDFNSPSELIECYAFLYEHGPGNTPHSQSRYIQILEREKSKKKGEGIISRFFSMFR